MIVRLVSLEVALGQNGATANSTVPAVIVVMAVVMAVAVVMAAVEVAMVKAIAAAPNKAIPRMHSKPNKANLQN